MPAKWQQWMPFKIDAFKASAAVQAMHPTARSGYLYLLSAAWQSEDCTISADPLDLAEESGLGDELWNEFGARILRKFEVTESGRLRNRVIADEWADAKRVFESRSASGHRTVSIRSPKTQHKVTDGLSVAQADTGTGTLTETVTKTSTGEQRASAPPPEPLSLNDDPEANIPEGLTLIQYRQFACEQLQAAKSYRNQVAMQEGIEAIVEHEGKTPAQATLSIIQRGREHPPDKGNWHFWVNDGGWKQQVQGLSTEGME